MIRKIGTQIFAGLICLLLIFFFTSVYAASSQDFVQYLPDTIDGVEKTSETQKMDMEKMGKKMCFVNQEYGDGITLTIADGSLLPQIKKFDRMKGVTGETNKKIVKQIQIEGYESGYVFYKQKNEGNIAIKLSDSRIVIIQAKDVQNPSELTSMADDVPISDIADQ